MILSVDAAQLEWRTALELSQDETGIREILEKQDAHALNQKAFNLPSRFIAKIYLFRTIFRGSGWSFANDPDFMHVSDSPKYWDAVNVKFFKKYAGLDRKHKEWAELVMAGKPLESPLGRFWHIPIPRDKKGEIYVPWTVLSNYPVQGLGADVMMLARLSMYNRLKKMNIEAKMIQTVHDSVVFDAPEKNVQPIVDMCHEVFRDLIPNIKKIFGYNWVVPLKCETKIGMNMKDMKEIAPSWER